ncbi:inorganic phosphate transporter [Halobacillus ihumii]|uniref:inorganic phosphate transporter n=1 Tax=Halobacillus ihumii TaxID=2686092 RepID=UPI0013D46765|nr:inorganic phosphate transporter [Halobacillus ihumii]
MTLIIIGLAVSCFFAFNVGASGSAATMGIAYGAQVIKKKRTALILSGVGGLLGALWGGEVVETIGKGLIASELLTVQAAVIILSVSAITLFFTNMIGIPLSTSEVTVGAIVGVGISLQQLYLENLIHVVTFWVIVPVVAFALTFCFGLFGNYWRKKRKHSANRQISKWISILLIITGFIEAFAAGMNNVANAIGPLVGAGVLPKEMGLLAGGVFIALGSILLGGRVLETNGKRISTLTLTDGVMVSGTSGVLVVGASLLGIPIPMTQVTTSAIVGVGATKNWTEIWRKRIIYQILKVWITSPIISLLLAYCLTEVFLRSNFYTVVMIACGILATLLLTGFGRKAAVQTQKGKPRSLKQEF